MSTANLGRGHTWGRERADDEGNPDTWATDAEQVEAGVLLHAVNIDGERRRVFVSDCVLRGLGALPPLHEGDGDEHEEADEPEAPDTYVPDLGAAIDRLEREVARTARSRDAWRDLAIGMGGVLGFEEAGRYLETHQPDEVFERVRRIVEAGRVAREKPLGEVAAALCLDERTQPELIIAQVRRLRSIVPEVSTVRVAEPTDVATADHVLSAFEEHSVSGQLTSNERALLAACRLLRAQAVERVAEAERMLTATRTALHDARIERDRLRREGGKS